MKRLILAALLVAGCASADQSPSMGSILADSAADTLSWATRGISADNATDALTEGLNPIAREAVQPLAAEVDRQLNAAHEDFQRRLDSSSNE